MSFAETFGEKKSISLLAVGSTLVMAISEAISPIIDSKCLHFGA